MVTLCATWVIREAGTLGRGVPEILLAVVQNNEVILNHGYAIAYRKIPAERLLCGAANG